MLPADDARWVREEEPSSAGAVPALAARVARAEEAAEAAAAAEAEAEALLRAATATEEVFCRLLEQLFASKER